MTPDTIEVGRLRVQVEQCRAWWDGQPLRLQKAPVRLLDTLARRPDWLFTRAQLLDAMDLHGTDRTVDVHVKRVRAALRAVDPEAGAVIETVYGMGYRLDPSRA